MSQTEGGHDADVKRLLGIEDMSCVVSDALRELGVGGAAGVPGIFPFGNWRRACGSAFTVRYEMVAADDQSANSDGAPDFDFHRLFARAQRGDVAMLECQVTDLAILGSMGATWARHFGIAGCVVNGAVRDVEALSAGKVPVWARHVTPMAGRGRLVQAEVGGSVLLGSVVVDPGDVVVADGNGVAVIPAGSLSAVVQAATDFQAAEAAAVRAAKTS